MFTRFGCAAWPGSPCVPGLRWPARLRACESPHHRLRRCTGRFLSRRRQDPSGMPGCGRVTPHHSRDLTRYAANECIVWRTPVSAGPPSRYALCSCGTIERPVQEIGTQRAEDPEQGEPEYQPPGRMTTLSKYVVGYWIYGCVGTGPVAGSALELASVAALWARCCARRRSVDFRRRTFISLISRCIASMQRSCSGLLS